jgi:hypothetical protein
MLKYSYPRDAVSSSIKCPRGRRGDNGVVCWLSVVWHQSVLLKVSHQSFRRILWDVIEQYNNDFNQRR